MFINVVAHYLPSTSLANSFFSQKCGVPESDIYKKTGIQERKKTSENENTNSMAIEVGKKLIEKLPFLKDEIDLIIGGTYTPFDTVGTLAHAIQREFNLFNARAISISTACSSFVNGIEIAQGYFALKKATKALIIVSENNSAYYDANDPVSGYLWGDGAAGAIISESKYSESDLTILDICTKGLAFAGKGPEGVYLKPAFDGLKMPIGRDVFQNACKYMALAAEEILHKNDLSIQDITYLIPHQANMRIINVVAETLKLDQKKVLNNIEYYGNTGCASSAIVLSENWNLYNEGDNIIVTVFGGGYSLGSMLLRR